MIASLMSLGAAGCIVSQVDESSEETSTIEQEFSAVGIDRMIPLRVFRMYQPIPAPTDTDLWEGLQQNVLAANDAFRPAGIQFYLTSISGCASTGRFSDVTNNTSYTFAEIEADLRCAFPNVVDPQTGSHTQRWWLDWATGSFGDAREIVLWIHERAGINNGILPWGGPPQAHLIADNVDISAGRKWLLAHELGHVFGLSHTTDWHNVVADTTLRHPVTGEPFKMSDMWDLVYRDSSGTVTCYNSAAGARVAEASGATLNLIHPSSTVSIDTCGCPTVALGGQTFTAGDFCLKGLAFSTAESCSPPSSYSCGVNVMSFMHDDNLWNQFFSDSQIELIRAYLRYEVRQSSDYSGHLGEMAGRTRLGYSANQQPAEKLDFNGDGLRDIAYWLAPTDPSQVGEVVIHLSPTFTSTFSVPFGALGDIPAFGDMDGDGRTNIVMVRPGGGSGAVPTNPLDTKMWWRWCASPSTLQSTMCSGSNLKNVEYGVRGDVPFGGLNFDGYDSTAELAVYRPGAWNWKQVYPTAGSSNTITLPTNPYVTNYVPLPGLYDNDFKTDLVGYIPNIAVFNMRLSSSDWSTDVWRGFPSTLIPTDGVGSTAQQRSGAVVVRGMIYHRLTGFLTYRPRLALSLFDPQDGNWYINWNPVAQSDPSAECHYGERYDIPLGGLGSSWGNRTSPYKSGFGLYRATMSNEGTTFFRDADGVCGGGTSYAYNHSFGTPRSTVSVVRDMTGDTLPEVLVVDPDTLDIHVLTSESHYQSSTYGGSSVPEISVGTHLAVLL